MHKSIQNNSFLQLIVISDGAIPATKGLHAAIAKDDLGGSNFDPGMEVNSKNGFRIPTHWIPVVQIIEGAPATKKLPVHHHRKMNIQDNVVVDGQSKDDPYELELGITLKRCRVEPVGLSLRIQREHGCYQTNESDQQHRATYPKRATYEYIPACCVGWRHVTGDYFQLLYSL